ncbi:MAG: VTT domain-containing protein [Myxococcota bacterium]
MTEEKPQDEAEEAEPVAFRTVALRALRSPGCIASIIFIILGVVLAKWVESIGGPEALMERYGMWAPVLSVPIHAIISISPLPGEAVVVAQGATFGFYASVPLGTVGWVLASAVEYALVRRSAEDVDFDALHRRLPRWFRRLPVEHPLFLIAGRWMPFGLHIVNISAGARKVPFWRHMWCSAVGSFPIAILFSAIGSGIRLL